MSVPQEKIIALLNRGFDYGEQTIEGWECSTNPFPVIKPTNNLIVLDLTSTQYIQLVSSILVGAEWAYPDQSHQILWNFIKSVHCPPIMAEQECFEYPPYASFMNYSPANPYVDPDFIPDGYLTQPFIISGTDIIVPFDSIPLDSNWLVDIGTLPQVQIVVQGAGKAFVKLLPQFNGGLACITVDNPPDLGDIFLGIVTGADNIMDLNMDVLSIPPETAEEIIYEIDIAGTGLHTIYVTFLPIIDDASIPLRFGGGFRGVQLCDFVEQPAMGIQQIRFDGGSCELQILVDGIWEQVDGWEDWLACVPSGGGGGGSANIKTTTYDVTLGASQTTTSTSFVHFPATEVLHTFIYPNALIMAHVLVDNNGSFHTYVAIRNNTTAPNNGIDGTEASNLGVTEKPIWAADRWEGLPLGTPQSIRLQMRVSGGTGTINLAQNIVYTIIEYVNAEDLFVEDIRIFGGELQKKIGGAWIAVSDSFEAIINSLQSSINTAQTTANGAVSTNTAQQAQINSILSVNTTQNSRLTALEAADVAMDLRMDDAELSIMGLNALAVATENRVDVLEAAVNVLEFGGAWAWLQDFTLSGAGYSAITGSYSAGIGWVISSTTDLHINYVLEPISENQVTHLQIQFFRDTDHATVELSLDGSNWFVCKDGLAGVNTLFWMRVPNVDAFDNFTIKMRVSVGFAVLNAARYLGRGDNCPFD